MTQEQIFAAATAIANFKVTKLKGSPSPEILKLLPRALVEECLQTALAVLQSVESKSDRPPERMTPGDVTVKLMEIDRAIISLPPLQDYLDEIDRLELADTRNGVPIPQAYYQQRPVVLAAVKLQNACLEAAGEPAPSWQPELQVSYRR